MTLALEKERKQTNKQYRINQVAETDYLLINRMIIRKKPLFRRVETKVAFFSQTNYLFVYEYNHVYMYMLFVCLVLLFIPLDIYLFIGLYIYVYFTYTHMFISFAFSNYQLISRFSYTLIRLCIQLSANFSFFIHPFMYPTII